MTKQDIIQTIKYYAGFRYNQWKDKDYILCDYSFNLIAEKFQDKFEQEKKELLNKFVDYLSDQYWKLWREYNKQYEASPQPQNDDEEMNSDTSLLLGICGGISMVLHHIYSDIKNFLN